MPANKPTTYKLRIGSLRPFAASGTFDNPAGLARIPVKHVDQRSVTAGVVEAERYQVMNTLLVHVRGRHRWAGWVVGRSITRRAYRAAILA